MLKCHQKKSHLSILHGSRKYLKFPQAAYFNTLWSGFTEQSETLMKFGMSFAISLHQLMKILLQAMAGMHFLKAWMRSWLSKNLPCVVVKSKKRPWLLQWTTNCNASHQHVPCKSKELQVCRRWYWAHQQIKIVMFWFWLSCFITIAMNLHDRSLKAFISLRGISWFLKKRERIRFMCYFTTVSSEH